MAYINNELSENIIARNIEEIGENAVEWTGRIDIPKTELLAERRSDCAV